MTRETVDQKRNRHRSATKASVAMRRNRKAADRLARDEVNGLKPFSPKREASRKACRGRVETEV